MLPGLLSCKTLKRLDFHVLYKPSSGSSPVLCSYTEGRGSLSLLFWGCPQPVGVCHTHTNTELLGCGAACSSYRDQKKAGSGGRMTLGIRALVEIATTFVSQRQDQRQTECQRGNWPLRPSPSCLTPTEGRRAFSEKKKNNLDFFFFLLLLQVYLA